MGSSGADVIVGIVVALLVVLAVRSMVKAKKAGKSMCGGDCGNCAMKGCTMCTDNSNDKQSDKL